MTTFFMAVFFMWNVLQKILDIVIISPKFILSATHLIVCLGLEKSCYSKCNKFLVYWPETVNITWQIVKNVKSQDPFLTHELES